MKQPWQAVREEGASQLLPQQKELYVLAQSKDRVEQGKSDTAAQTSKAWSNGSSNC